MQVFFKSAAIVIGMVVNGQAFYAFILRDLQSHRLWSVGDDDNNLRWKRGGFARLDQ